MMNAAMYGMIESLEAMLSRLLKKYEEIACMYCAVFRPR